jgi:dUTP pyrophosphatase
MTSGSVGCDVTARESLELPPGSTAAVSTGLFLEVPDGYECQVRPRSGLALKHGITVINSPGSIDSDYRGEIKVILINHGPSQRRVEVGDRIAQLVFAPVARAHFMEVDALTLTDRGGSGFGSTGERS